MSSSRKSILQRVRRNTSSGKRTVTSQITSIDQIVIDDLPAYLVSLHDNTRWYYRVEREENGPFDVLGYLSGMADLRDCQQAGIPVTFQGEAIPETHQTYYVSTYSTKLLR